MTKSPAKLIGEFLDFAHELADASGRVILPQFRKRIAIEAKAGRDYFDPVTAADRAAERTIRAMIVKRWPDHGIVGEEYAEKQSASRYRWVIDPIDGTRSFVIGLPVWGTLIALLDEDQPLVGMMDQPYTGERFWSSGGASYSRTRDTGQRRLRTRPCLSLASAMMATTHPDLFNAGRQKTLFNSIKSQVRDTRYGGDCYSYCLLAAGHIDIVMEANLKPHDIVALIPIIENAGGAITTWTGKPATSGGTVLACGDVSLHRQILDIIAK